MNYLWAFMILTGVVFAAFHGTLPAVTQAALDSAKEAVTLCITMMGVMSFWVGLMKIAEKTGIIAGLSRRLAPVLHFLFPDIPKDHPANKYIATNMIANIFGLGWAATPAGLKAMEALAELEKERGKKAFSDGTVKKGSGPPATRCVIFDHQYFIPSDHTGKHYCLPQPVWKCESGADRRSGTDRNDMQYTDCDYFL